MSVDLIVFGPHPDDIEIGLGGTVARRHAAEGRSVGLCDLTAGELGSNGTPAERLAEGCEAARVLGAALAREPRLARWRHRNGRIIRSAVNFIRRHRPGRSPLPHWQDRHPDHVAASAVLTAATFTSGLRRFDTGPGPWRPEWICYYFINDSAPRVVRRRCVRTLRDQARGARLPSQPVRAGRGGRRRHSPDRRRPSASSSRAATRSSARWPASRLPKGWLSASRSCGRRCCRTPVRMKIGIVCYASVGGSGVVATELAHALAWPRPSGAPALAANCRSAGASARPALRARRHACLSRCSANRSTCWPWPHRSCASPAIDSSTSCTHTTRSRMRRPPISPRRCSARTGARCGARGGRSEMGVGPHFALRKTAVSNGSGP